MSVFFLKKKIKHSTPPSLHFRDAGVPVIWGGQCRLLPTRSMSCKLQRDSNSAVSPGCLCTSQEQMHIQPRGLAQSFVTPSRSWCRKSGVCLVCFLKLVVATVKAAALGSPSGPCLRCSCCCGSCVHTHLLPDASFLLSVFNIEMQPSSTGCGRSPQKP